MPKRRVTPARAAQLRAFQAAGARARRERHWPPAVPGSFGTVRRHKLGGKAYQKKSGSSFTPSPEAAAILAGTAGFRNRATSDKESHDAMAPLHAKLSAAMGHPMGVKVPKPKALRGTNKPPGANKTPPSKLHGSGTGLSSAFRYGIIGTKSKGRGK